MVRCPEGLNYWTADEVSECLGVSKETRIHLWKLLSEANNPTPLGGDGSNGTVETPDGRLSLDNDDKMINVWGKLTLGERVEIIRAYGKHLVSMGLS